jgi:rhodanese-related sulfurtransferase
MPAADPAPEPAPRVEAPDIDAALESGALMLDVRTAEELAEHGTIDGFVHIPIDELEARIGELPAGVPILTA